MLAQQSVFKLDWIGLGSSTGKPVPPAPFEPPLCAPPPTISQVLEAPDQPRGRQQRRRVQVGDVGGPGGGLVLRDGCDDGDEAGRVSGVEEGEGATWGGYGLGGCVRGERLG